MESRQPVSLERDTTVEIIFCQSRMRIEYSRPTMNPILERHLDPYSTSRRLRGLPSDLRAHCSVLAAFGWAVLTTGCQDLWLPYGRDNPANCVQVPDACDDTQTCNKRTEVCVPRLDLDAISPAFGPSSGGIELHGTGRGFTSGMTLSLGMPGRLATLLTLESESELRATLPAQPAACGPQPITITRPDGITVSRANLFSYYVGNVAFASGQPVSQPAFSNSTVYLISADLNRDGKADIVSTAYNHSGIDVLLGDGSGAFIASQRIPTGAGPYHLAVADVDGNGWPDLAVTNNTGNTVSILLGSGGGAFSAPVNLMNMSPLSAQFIDVDADGKLDLAVLANGRLRLWTGNGQGTFSFKNEINADSGAALSTAADVDGDGRSDLIVQAGSGTYLSVFRNNGDGTFRSIRTTPLTSAAASCASADFNEDGKPDLVAAEYAAGLVSVLPGRGDGTFDPPRSIASRAGSRILALGDLNCDGHVDVAVSHLGTPQVGVLLGRGDGSFDSNTLTVVAPGATSALGVAIGDLNGDSRPDLLIGVDGTSPSVHVAFNMSQ